MIFTNLEKYVYSKKCLKQRRQPVPLPPAKSKVFSHRKSHLATAVIGGRPVPIPNKVCDLLGKQSEWWHNNASIPENNR